MIEWVNLTISLATAFLCIVRAQEIARQYASYTLFCLLKRLAYLFLASLCFIHGFQPVIDGIEPTIRSVLVIGALGLLVVVVQVENHAGRRSLERR